MTPDPLFYSSAAIQPESAIGHGINFKRAEFHYFLSEQVRGTRLGAMGEDLSYLSPLASSQSRAVRAL